VGMGGGSNSSNAVRTRIELRVRGRGHRARWVGEEQRGKQKSGEAYVDYETGRAFLVFINTEKDKAGVFKISVMCEATP